MKKFILSIALIAAVFMVSCSGGNSPETNETETTDDSMDIIEEDILNEIEAEEAEADEMQESSNNTKDPDVIEVDIN